MLQNLKERTDGQIRKDFETIVHAFKYAIETQPKTTALICGKDQATYNEYGHVAAHVARFLFNNGIKKDDRVVICASVSIKLPMIIFGILAARAQITMINPHYKEREIAPLINITKPSLIFCDNSSTAVFNNILLENETKLINVDGPKNTWQDTSASDLPIDLPNRDDGAVIMFTGGTTGTSKGVPLTHYKVMAAMELIEDRWPTNLGTEILLNIPPIFHITGLYHGCFQPVFGCNQLVLLPRFHPDLVFQAINNQSISVIIIGVPTAYAALLSHPCFDTVDFSAVKFSGSGGAPLAEQVKTEWEKRTGIPALEGYGMTEGAPTCNNPLIGFRKSHSAGRPVSCTDFRIVDVKNGRTEMPIGEKGEIIVRGPHIADKYYNDEEATTAAFKDGWLHTGDVAYLDEDGFVFIVDRLKDMAIVSGFNVFPREIDEVLISHPKIIEAATIGIQDDYRGEVIKAFISVKKGEDIDEEELKKFCAQNLVKYKIPTVFEFTNNLPKTPVGKIDKKKLNN